VGRAPGVDPDQIPLVEDRMSELESGFRIGDVVAMVRRRWLIVGLAAVAGVVAGVAVFASIEAPFSATARVRVQPIQINQFETEGREPVVDIATEKDLVKSDSVAEAVREELELDAENRTVLSRISVITEEDSLVMQITYVADTATAAQAGADAVARGYLDQRASTAATTRDNALDRLDIEIATAQSDLSDAQGALDAEPDGSPDLPQLRAEVQSAQNQLASLQSERAQLVQFDPDTVGQIVRTASLPPQVTSKKAIGLGVGVFGIFLAAGLALAWIIDRRDTLGGGRRRLEQLVPGANVRIMPGAEGGKPSAAEIDTAVDRLAVELVAGHAPGTASSVLVVGTGTEPPVELAEELAASLTFAGIPTLFVLAGTSQRQPRHSHAVASFADLVNSTTPLAGPLSLPATTNGTNGTTPTNTPTVTWLRPRESAESAGLLRRAVVQSLVTRASSERYEAVVFVAPSPTRSATTTALGQWVDRTALVVAPADRPRAEDMASALTQADVELAEVVFT
jgi:capsular polysaccharide biosynthesis protein